MPLFPVVKSGSTVQLTAATSGKGGRQYTLSQLIAAQEAAKREKDRSFLGKVFEGGKGGAVFALRQLLRPSLAVTTGLYRGIEGEDAFDLGDALHGAREGFMLRDHQTGKNVLTELGWAGGGKLKSVAGFGIDVLTDPTLPLQVAATVLSGGTAAPALIAGRAALAGAAKASVNASTRYKAAKEALELFAKEGDTFSINKALAAQEGALAKLQMVGARPNEAFMRELQFTRLQA